MNFFGVLLRFEIIFGALTADQQFALMLLQAQKAQLHLVQNIVLALF
jgi:hypothetical protein